MFSLINRIIVSTPAFLITVIGIISIFIMIFLTPALDRDESRYAQTSFQISETNDFFNLQFQDSPRLKKPPGIYWLQFASFKIFNNFFDKEIWIFRIISLLSLLVLLFYTHKLAKLLFYDINSTIPITALTGTIIIIVESLQATTDMAYAAFSLMSYYFFIKSFNEEKNYSNIFFIFSSLAAMIIKGPVFLILIIIIYFYKFANFNISLKKKIIILSNISIVVLVSITLALIYNISTNGQFLQHSLINDFGAKLIETQESHGGFFGYYFLGSFLIVFPIYPLMLIGIFFNLFKKINWDQNLLLILISIFSFIFLLELIPTKLPHYILPVVPLMAIYFSRTLEFIEFKWSKVFFLFNLFIVVGFLFVDYKSFEITGEDRKNISFIYYFLMIIPLMLNPIFYKNNQSLLNIVKINSLSCSLIVLITVMNLIFIHKNIWISSGIKDFIAKNYDCNEGYQITIEGINEPSLIFNFYENFDSSSNCSIKVIASEIDDMPIDNTNSTNLSYFNYSNNKKINLNFSKQ